MLLVVLFAAGFVVALGAASALRRARARLVLGGAAAAVWAGYSIYLAAFAPCPEHGECEKGLAILFGAAILAGWLAGAAASWLLRPTDRGAGRR